MEDQLVKGEIYDRMLQSNAEGISKEIARCFQADFTFEEKCALRVIGAPARITKAELSRFTTTWPELLSHIESAIVKAQDKYLEVSSMPGHIRKEVVYSVVYHEIVFSLTAYLINNAAEYDKEHKGDAGVKMPMVELPQKKHGSIDLPVESMSYEVRVRIDMILSGRAYLSSPDNQVTLPYVIKQAVKNRYFQYRRLSTAYAFLGKYYLQCLDNSVARVDLSKSGVEWLQSAYEKYMNIVSLTQVQGGDALILEYDQNMLVNARGMISRRHFIEMTAASVVSGSRTNQEAIYLLSEIVPCLDLDTEEEIILLSRNPQTRELIDVRLPFLGMAIASWIFEPILDERRRAEELGIIHARVKESLPVLAGYIDSLLLILDINGVIDLWDIDRNLKLISLALNPSHHDGFVNSLFAGLHGAEQILGGLDELISAIQLVTTDGIDFAEGIDMEKRLLPLAQLAVNRYLQREAVIKYIGSGLARNLSRVQGQFQNIAPYIDVDMEIPPEIITIKNARPQYEIRNIGELLLVRATLAHMRNKSELRKIRSILRHVGIWKEEYGQFFEEYNIPI